MLRFFAVCILPLTESFAAEALRASGGLGFNVVAATPGALRGLEDELQRRRGSLAQADDGEAETRSVLSLLLSATAPQGRLCLSPFPCVDDAEARAIQQKAISLCAFNPAVGAAVSMGEQLRKRPLLPGLGFRLNHHR